jgi:diguanylate cyclase (GGDEF)-like protein
MGERSRKVSQGLNVPGSMAIGVRGSRRHRAWIAVAVAIFVAGTAGSLIAGRAVAQNASQKSQKAFAASSNDIASTLQLAIQHEQDLIVSASGFVAGNPSASNAEFVKWANSVNALGRYPELVGIGHSVIVPAAALPAFAAQAVTDPAGPLAANGTFEVVPPGNRPYYCLSIGSLSRSAQAAFPAGTDFCATGPVGTASLASRDSGKGAYLPIQAPKTTLLSILTPVYQGGTVPGTEAERQSTFLGWVGMAVVPQVVLARALEGHPNTAVTLHYEAGTSNVEFRSGRASSGAQSLAINLQNGWTVTTFGAVTAGGILRNQSAFAVVLAGALLSLLLGTLLFVLATARARALRVISRQTGELRHQALHDGLTGLPNRALIMDRIEQLLARNRRQGTMGAALYVDLDEFKNVNDSLGHEAGDRLLVAVAARLQSTLRDADTIGRMGGDEFVVLIDGASLQVAPEMVADRLLEVMRQPFELEGATMPLIVNTSIGIAMGDRDSPGDLLRDADVALYQAKAAGKNRYEIFHAEMQTDIQNRIELEFDLRSALEGDQFHLVYQPIYNLDDLTMVGVEALLRWDHPTRGIVGPDEFIPILEQTGQIREVGRWVLGHACQQMADWHDRGSVLDISVNVSGRQLDDDAIVEHISGALAVSGLPATSLIIEVTETALMRNADATAKRLHSIKELGVRIAVDDFGTGYSSLAYLQRFPVDCLKIDQSFTNAITASPESKALIGTLVQLGKDLGLTTLAEGVETSSQMAHLRGEHVNEAQGFLLARPLDALTLETELLMPARLAQGVAVSGAGKS